MALEALPVPAPVVMVAEEEGERWGPRLRLQDLMRGTGDAEVLFESKTMNRV